MANIAKKGFFITLYGINNIGKSTHVRRLAERLRSEGSSVETVKYPVYDLVPSGPFLNKILRQSSRGQQALSEKELQLWFTLNRYQFEPQIRKWLSQGKIILAEDYVGTGIAWGTAKGVDESWLMQMNRYLLQENLALLLVGDRTLKAREANHLHETNDALIEKTVRVFYHLARKYHWKIVSIEPRKEDTAQKIYNVVKKFLRR